MPVVILPCPSALKLPVLANGVGVVALVVNTSPLVTKAYVPLKLAGVKLPDGGGGGMEGPPPPLQAAAQRTEPATTAKRMRFIAHLAGLPSALQATAGSLWCCEQQRSACPSARCGHQSRCYRRGPALRPQRERCRLDSKSCGWQRAAWRCQDARPRARKRFAR